MSGRTYLNCSIQSDIGDVADGTRKLHGSNWERQEGDGGDGGDGRDISGSKLDSTSLRGSEVLDNLRNKLKISRLTRTCGAKRAKLKRAKKMLNILMG